MQFYFISFDILNMNNKIIALGLHEIMLNNYSTDLKSFQTIDIGNLQYYEFPTFEFSLTVNQLETLRINPSLNNIQKLTTEFCREIKKATQIDIGLCREQNLNQLYPITAHYHIARLYLGVIYQHINLFKDTINFQELVPLLEEIQKWYSAELAKITPEMSEKQIETQLALCLVRKTNLFIRNLSNLFPSQMINYPLLIKPLPNLFLR